jgi:hypothetical protein
MSEEIRFTRPLTGGEVGMDVEGIGRALCRADVGYVPLRVFNAMPRAWRRTYGSRKQAAVNVIRKGERRRQNGVYDQRVHDVLSDAGAFDAKAAFLMESWKPPPVICYPHARGEQSVVCQGLHPTAGLVGNWAMDFCAPGGTTVVAVEDGIIQKLSGRDPATGADQLIGIFGWNIYYRTSHGYVYFSTHYGEKVALMVGQRVLAGEKLGEVGRWPGNPGRSHTHLGVTSPLGTSDAKKRITAISQAPRVVPR